MSASLAIIDLGTNTFNLLIMQGTSTLVNTKIPVKLGEGGITRGSIAPAAYERGLAALQEYAQLIAQHGVEATYAFATSALREAANGADFCADAQRQTGIVVNIISGEQEALFIADGVRLAMALPEQPVLVMDIGGGSTEFIVCSAGHNHWFKSYPLGVSRLHQMFLPQDPMTAHDITRAQNYIHQMLTDLWEAIRVWQPQTLVGSSGSFDTLTSMLDHRLRTVPTEPVPTSRTLAADSFHQLCADLLGATVQERLAMPGMIPMRADTIGYSCLLIQAVMHGGPISQLMTSAFSLKEGVLKTLATPHHPWQKSWL
jgi:exopolyphosphatase/guanosine-5'-triphosphate,3'-diphosphate pyrophosphatase